MTAYRDETRRRIASTLQAAEDRFDKLLKLSGISPFSQLRSADLRDVNFEGANLVGWDFREANLTGASFQGADIRGCLFDGAIGLDLTGAISSNPANIRIPTPEISYRGAALCVDGVSVNRLADAVQTPFYCYSSTAIERRYREFIDAFRGEAALVCYALKANSNQSILTTLGKLGSGATVASGGELKRALAAGISPEKIVFSGVGKTESELRAALAANIYCINVESEPELELLSRLAVEAGRTARVSLRIDPSDARTASIISASTLENKFGIPIAAARTIYARAATLSGIGVTGISMHIGSQITDIQWLEASCRTLVEFAHALRADGHNIAHVNFGGGVGIPYYFDRQASPTTNEYAAMIKRITHNLGCTLLFEPGRMIVGAAGILATRVIYVKSSMHKHFVIVDAAMNDLLRPTLYEAHHEILPAVQPAADAPTIVADVVGPVCETGDYMALDRKLWTPEAGDLLAIVTAGAYSAAQSTTYNTRPLIPEVLVRDDQYALIRPRVEVEQLIAMDRAAPWQ